MYEYKPQVPTSPEDIHLPHLCEVLLQGYYCVKRYTPVLHCLTDLTDWHYLMLEHDRENDCLDIKWTCSFKAENLSQEHLNFLYRAVKPILDSIAIKHGLDGMSTSS